MYTFSIFSYIPALLILILSSPKVGATCGWVPVHCSHRWAFYIPTRGCGVIYICFWRIDGIVICGGEPKCTDLESTRRETSPSTTLTVKIPDWLHWIGIWTPGARSWWVNGCHLADILAEWVSDWLADWLTGWLANNLTQWSRILCKKLIIPQAVKTFRIFSATQIFFRGPR